MNLNMKKYIKTILVASCILVFTECDNQLNLTPMGELTASTFYQTENDFEAASLAPYSTLLNLYFDQGGHGFVQGILMPDDDLLPSNNSSNEVEDFNWTSSNDRFAFVWAECYKGVQRANVIIDRLPEANGFADEANKARFEAEAKFLRAYFHFMLAANWGTPPVILASIKNFEESLVANSQPGEIWQAIIDDLTYAKQNLPAEWDEANTGRVTNGAATALLGKAFLYRAQFLNQPADYAEAITNFNEVISSNVYSLLPNYADNFSPTLENNAESLFEVQFTEGDFNTWLATDFGTPENQDVGFSGSARMVVMRPACGPSNVCAPGANGSGYGNVATSPSLMAAVQDDDPRRPYIFFEEGDDYYGTPFDADWSATGSTPSKYIGLTPPNPFPPNSDYNNDRIIRYADVLLMLAEAELLGNNDISTAADLINEVRRRADPTEAILAPVPSNVTTEEMFDFLMAERRVELAFEGHRYNDLVRWHRAGLIDIATDVDFGRTPANSSWDTKYLLKPIPQRDLDLNNNLQQNAGY
jgi:starch-binding outer membrane protein, SusD/RagB family